MVNLKNEIEWGGLKFWLLMDSWSLQEASLILCGIIPDSVHYEKDDEKNKIRAFWKFDCSFHNLKGTGDSDVDGFNDICFFHTLIKRLIKPESIFEMSPHQWVEKAKIKQIDIIEIEKCLKEIYILELFNEKLINKDNQEKLLSNRERNTLLIIIAALAKEAKVDILKPSKAGELIANMTDLLGVSISATSIESKLKEIPNAIECRAK